MRILLFMFCFLLVASAGVAQANMVLNPWLESGSGNDFTNWTEVSGETGALTRVTGGQQHAGTYGAKIVHASASSYSWLKQYIPVKANTTYTATAWIKGSNISSGLGQEVKLLVAADPGGNTLGATQSYYGTFEWQKVSVTFNTGANTSIMFIVYLHEATGTVWIDDLDLIPPIPGSIPETQYSNVANNPFSYLNYYRQTYTWTFSNPSYQTMVTRISRYAEFDEYMSNFCGTFTHLQHEYSRKQAWNSDGTRLILNGGWRWRALLDGTATYAFIAELANAPLDWNWSRSNPDLAYGIQAGTCKFVKITPSTDQLTVVKDFAEEFSEIKLGADEGNLSWDDSKICMAGRSGDDLVLRVINVSDGSTVAQRTFTGAWSSYNWAAISPNGQYVIYRKSGVPYPYEHKVMSISGGSLNDYWTIYCDGHGDFQKYNGNDVWLTVGAQNQIIRWNLSAQTQTVILEANDLGLGQTLYGHISGQCYNLPGWCLISCLDGDGIFDIFLLKLDGSETIRRFGWDNSTRPAYNPYYAEPKASVSPDGNKVIFASDQNAADDFYTSSSFVIERY
ncbi:MAG: hypothetical protein PHT33_06100 [bacterium]|nr:hypothetical protein [bacterium]